jgi:hypothetical protein
VPIQAAGNHWELVSQQLIQKKDPNDNPQVGMVQDEMFCVVDD